MARSRRTVSTPPRPSFAWKDKTYFPVTADTAKDALDNIAASNNGRLTPQIVVEAARAPNHALHKCFIWDDREAAARHRESQARRIIHCIVKIRQDPTGARGRTQIAYISVKPDPRTDTERRRFYLPTEEVLNDMRYRDQAIQDALAAAEGWRRRYGQLAELAGVANAIDDARRRYPRPGE